MVTINYFSYLIRIWQDDKAISGNWLASLEDIHSKELTYFKSMEALFAFLGQATGEERDEGISKN